MLELPIEIAPKPPNPLFFPVCFYRNPARRRLAIANYVSTGTPYVLELPIEIAPKPPNPLFFPVCFYRNPARRRLAIANYVSTGTPYVLELPIEIAPKPPWPLLLNNISINSIKCLNALIYNTPIQSQNYLWKSIDSLYCHLYRKVLFCKFKM